MAEKWFHSLETASKWVGSLNSPSQSDCAISCGQYYFKLHKVILASHSEYFKVAFKGDTFKEGASGIIELKSCKDDNGEYIETEDGFDDRDDPEIIKIMVNYMYHYNYYPFGETPSVPDSLIAHAKVFATAIKYQVEGLVDLAARRFGRRLNHDFDAEEFVACIRFVYDSTPEDAMQLRNTVANTLVDKFDSLQHSGMLEELMASIPELGCNVLRLSALAHKQEANACQHDRKLRTSWCRQCFLKLPYCRKCWSSDESRPTCPTCDGNLVLLDPYEKA